MNIVTWLDIIYFGFTTLVLSLTPSTMMVDYSQPPKMVPFNGANCLDWVLQVERYFFCYYVPDSLKLSLASLFIEGEAREWFCPLYRNHIFQDWDHFIDELFVRFRYLDSRQTSIPACSQQFTEAKVCSDSTVCLEAVQQPEDIHEAEDVAVDSSSSLVNNSTVSTESFQISIGTSLKCPLLVSINSSETLDISPESKIDVEVNSQTNVAPLFDKTPQWKTLSFLSTLSHFPPYKFNNCVDIGETPEAMFWDMKEFVIFLLSCGSVDSARIHPRLDNVLDELCVWSHDTSLVFDPGGLYQEIIEFYFSFPRIVALAQSLYGWITGLQCGYKVNLPVVHYSCHTFCNVIEVTKWNARHLDYKLVYVILRNKCLATSAMTTCSSLITTNNLERATFGGERAFRIVHEYLKVTDSHNQEQAGGKIKNKNEQIPHVALKRGVIYITANDFGELCKYNKLGLLLHDSFEVNKSTVILLLYASLNGEMDNGNSTIATIQRVKRCYYLLGLKVTVVLILFECIMKYFCTSRTIWDPGVVPKVCADHTKIVNSLRVKKRSLDLYMCWHSVAVQSENEKMYDDCDFFGIVHGIFDGIVHGIFDDSGQMLLQVRFEMSYFVLLIVRSLTTFSNDLAPTSHLLEDVLTACLSGLMFTLLIVNSQLVVLHGVMATNQTMRSSICKRDYICKRVSLFSFMWLYSNLEDKVLNSAGSIVMNGPDVSYQDEALGPRNELQLGQLIQQPNKRLV